MSFNEIAHSSKGVILTILGGIGVAAEAVLDFFDYDTLVYISVLFTIVLSALYGIKTWLEIQRIRALEDIQAEERASKQRIRRMFDNCHLQWAECRETAEKNIAKMEELTKL